MYLVLPFSRNYIGIERGLTSKLEDARDAIVNKTIDILGVYKSQVLGFGKASSPQLSVPSNLKLLPLLALSLVKNVWATAKFFLQN